MQALWLNVGQHAALWVYANANAVSVISRYDHGISIRFDAFDNTNVPATMASNDRDSADCGAAETPAGAYPSLRL